MEIRRQIIRHRINPTIRRCTHIKNRNIHFRRAPASASEFDIADTKLTSFVKYRCQTRVPARKVYYDFFYIVYNESVYKKLELFYGRVTRFC